MQASPPRLEWPDLYYYGVEHLLWYPDWIGMQPGNPRKPVRAAMNRLRTLEAPLHHAIQLFLTLAPTEFVARLFGIETDTPLHIVRCPDWKPLMVNQKAMHVLDLCQPDIFIEGPGVQVAIEVKARGKSSLKQVLKYAAMLTLRARELPPGSRKLVFLAPRARFVELFDRRALVDADAVKEHLRTYDDQRIDQRLRSFGTSLEEVKASLDSFDIIWQPLRDLRNEVETELRRLGTDPSASGEVYRNLLSGFLPELERWLREIESAAPRLRKAGAGQAA